MAEHDSVSKSQRGQETRVDPPQENTLMSAHACHRAQSSLRWDSLVAAVCRQVEKRCQVQLLKNKPGVSYLRESLLLITRQFKRYLRVPEKLFFNSSPGRSDEQVYSTDITAGCGYRYSTCDNAQPVIIWKPALFTGHQSSSSLLINIPPAS